MSISRIHRLLQLITLLQSGRARSVDDLLADLDVSRRTLFRDLKALQAAGVPYYYDPAAGYRIARSFFLPPISLTVPEALGLMLMGKMAGSRRDLPLREASLGAVNKFVATIPEPIRTACTDLMSHITVNPGPRSADDGGNRYYADLQRCVDEGRVCLITYKSPIEPEAFTCRLKPYAMHYATRAWYVLGRTNAHKEVRVFKLARIVSLKQLESRFERPSRFRVESVLGKAWQLIPEGKVYQVEVEFTSKVAMNVSEVLWHSSQKHRILPDGRCRMTFEVDGLNEIAWWLCGYAGQVSVRKPVSLRRLLERMHREAWQKHQDGGDLSITTRVKHKSRVSADR